jgi:Holliday junction resolvase RusA-like endonuclease
MVKIVISGNPATKKNSMQIVKNRYTGQPRLIQSKTYRAYEEWFTKQFLVFYHRDMETWQESCPINRKINLKCIYYMETKRKVDLVNLLNATCDCLVKVGVLLDDNHNIIAGVDGSRVYYDKENPRVEIYIEEFENDN